MKYRCTNCGKKNDRECEADGRFVCDCGHAQTIVTAAPCSLRGEEKRLVLCESCTGSVRVKVYACEVFNECSMSKDVGVAICAGCKSRSPQ